MKWIVFGGWACPPTLLEDIFGKAAQYIDVNLLIPSLIENGRLAANWKERIAMQFRDQTNGGAFSIAGWSTGALPAYALAAQCTPTSALYLSPTASFCRREQWEYGAERSALRSMRLRLAGDQEGTLKDFFVNAQLRSPFPDPMAYSSSHLRDGLIFLEQATLLPLSLQPYSSIVAHGVKDRIIPYAAGKLFASAIGARLVRLNAGHAVFQEAPEKIAALLQ